MKASTSKKDDTVTTSHRLVIVSREKNPAKSKVKEIIEKLNLLEIFPNDIALDMGIKKVNFQRFFTPKRGILAQNSKIHRKTLGLF